MTFRKTLPVLATLMLALASLPSVAGAQCAVPGNLVANCGFETGNFSGWTMGTPFITSNWNIVASSTNGNFEHSGAEAWWGGYVGQPTFLSQTLSTVPGASYSFGFWFKSFGGAQPRALVAQWDGTDLVNVTGMPEADWSYYSFNVVASTSSTTFAIGTQQDYGYNGIDDVVVTGVATPEPAELVYMVTGLIGVGMLVRRRRMVAG